MRDFKNMKRQRGRNRGGNQGGGGGKPQAQNANRAFDSNGPDNIKIRGHAQHVYEKYQQLARDASSAGDRVLAENYLQHAEHYFRTIRALQPHRPVTEIVGRETFTSGFDIDFEDESVEAAIEATDTAAMEREANGVGQPQEGEGADGGPSLQQGGQNQGGQGGQQGQGGQSQGGQGGQNQGGQNRPRWEDRPPRDRDRYQDRPREDRYQNDRPRDDRPRYENDRPRSDQPRSDQPRSDQPRTDQSREDRYQGERVRNNDPRDQARSDQPREDRPREDRPREDRGDRPRYENRAERGDRSDRPYRDRPREDRLSSDGDVNSPVVAPAGEGAAPERDPGRPARVLRSDAGDVSHAPAFLQVVTPAPAPAAEDGERPKRTRTRRPKAEAGEPSEG